MATSSEPPPSLSSPKHSSQTLELKSQVISPNNSPRTPALASRLPLHSSSKGKSKIEDVSMADSDSICCGICLSEEGKAVRGWIDSCDHFFCFVCIMEWSKVESRCPMCKRRFSSIRRSPKDGIFTSERIVSVPVRDQVYHSFGNSTMGPPDRYSEVKCSVCQGTQDEYLLLLCDLCDSAAHSFCAGLGHTVPQGDWYCQDCTILKDEHANNESNPEEHVSIFEIVHESDINSPTRRIKIPVDGQLPIDKTEREVSVTEQDSETVPSESSARTLKRCRDITGRIIALRENWSAFQSGSSSFTSSSVNRPNTGAVVSCDRSTNDIDKAWKMFNAAKSISKGIVCSVSKQSLRDINVVKDAKVSTKLIDTKSISESFVCSVSKQPLTDVNVVKDAKVSTKLIVSNSKKRASEDPVFCGSAKRNQSEDPPKGNSQVYCELPTSKKDSVQVDISHGNVRDPPKGNSFGETSNVFCDQHKCKTDNSCSDSSAKSEIQSLVKLNLKLLTRDKKLEIDMFKEVARLSTHSILAACGLESPKRGVCSFTSSICHHVNEGQQFRKSTLMPSSCRECFFGFVKDVVNTIMIEKLG